MTLSSISIDTASVVQLAIETTGRTGSVAILQGESVLDDVVLAEGSRTAAALSPALREAIGWCRRRGLQPGLISVAAGPGSFTGLRIGVTTAKTLSYATGWPLVAVDSLAAIAATVLAQLPADRRSAASRIRVGINAYRRQVFSGCFTGDQLLPPSRMDEPRLGQMDQPDAPLDQRDAPVDQPDVRVLPLEAWQAVLERLEPGTVLAGDRQVFGESAGAEFVPRHSGDAVGVGLLGLRAARAGQWADPISLVPRYLKPSAAEEKTPR